MKSSLRTLKLTSCVNYIPTKLEEAALLLAGSLPHHPPSTLSTQPSLADETVGKGRSRAAPRIFINLFNKSYDTCFPYAYVCGEKKAHHQATFNS